jgi:hypothetical protein
MWQYLKEHERVIRAALEASPSSGGLAALRQTHARRLAFFQHERLIHLLVTLFVALFFLLVLGFAMVRPTLPAGALVVTLLCLTVAYLLHYYRLENGVQRLYELSDRLEERIAGAPPGVGEQPQADAG